MMMTKRQYFQTTSLIMFLSFWINTVMASAIPQWSETVIYNSGDKAGYNSNVYEALWWTKGNIPTNGAPWTLIENNNPEQQNASAWSPTATYTAGASVSYQGGQYVAQWWTQGDFPDKSAAWKHTGASTDTSDNNQNQDDSQQDENSPNEEDTSTSDNNNDNTNENTDTGNYPAYQEGTKYAGGAIVSNGGKLYLCNAGSTSGWCSGVAWAYEPGKGSAWQDAWRVTDGQTTQNDESNNNDQGTDNQDTSTGQDDTNQSDKGDQVYTVKLSDLQKREVELTSSDLMKQVKNSIATLDNVEVEKVVAGRVENPNNVKRVEQIVSADDWDFLFAKRAAEYTYQNFLKAVSKFPAFCGDYQDGRNAEAICRKSLSTMFAHFGQETGGHTAHWDVPQWRQGLHWIREMGWNEAMRGGYNGECNPDTWQGQTWPCGTFENGDYKSYFGRGAKQLSYNYNYGPFSYAMFGDVRVLMDNPELVADTWLNLASAVFFFVYPQPPKPSMLHVIDGTWTPNARDLENGLTPGFGVTTQIINGGVECGGTNEIQQSLNRIEYYLAFTDYLNVEVAVDEVLGCKGMKQFDEAGSGALPIYWEQDWGWSNDTPTGETYACKLVGYQTPFSVFKPGDYSNCVKHFFKVEINEEN